MIESLELATGFEVIAEMLLTEIDLPDNFTVDLDVETETDFPDVFAELNGVDELKLLDDTILADGLVDVWRLNIDEEITGLLVENAPEIETFDSDAESYN